MRTQESQRKVIKAILDDGKSITSMEAFELGITRLSAIIFDLRKQGMGIVTDMRTTRNIYGNTCQYASYRKITEEDLNAEN